MLDRLMEWIGLDSVLRDNLAATRLGWRYPEILWLGLALLPLGAWLVHRRHAQSLPMSSKRLRHGLTGLRVAILAAVLLILAGPHLALDLEIAKKPALSVVVDQTRSMDLPAGTNPSDAARQRLVELIGPGTGTDGKGPGAGRSDVDRLRRVDLARRVLAAEFPRVFAPLADRYDLRVFALHDELVPLTVDVKDGKATLETAPEPGAGQTRLGAAIERLVADAAGKPMGGIVLLSDGQNNGGASFTQAAFAARAAKAPIFTVPVGAEARPRDIALVDVFCPSVVSKDDTPRIAVTLQSSGYDDQTVEVVLKEQGKTIERKPLRLSGKELQHLEFTYRATELGARVLSVEVDRRPDETIAANNRDRVALRVTDEKLKILLVDGTPRWDFRFLRNALERDPGVKLEWILEAENGRLKKSLPTSAAAYADYSAVIVGDVSPRLLTPEAQSALVAAVREQGLGVIFAVGPRYLPQAYRDRPLESLFPVVPEKAAGRLAPGYDAFGLELTPTGRSHEVVRLYDEPSRNEETWVALPPFYWCGAAQRLRPGAVALAVNRALKNDYGTIPLVAYQDAGDGAALYVGLDSTWSWRQNVADRYFYKFWGQALRYVARRPGDGKDRARLEASPLKLAPGEEVGFTLRAPVDGATAEVTIERIGDVETGRADPAGSAPPARLELHRDAEAAGAGRFTGKLKLSREGRFQATYQSAMGPVTAEFLSMEGIAEFQRPEVNREAMEAAAQNSGGRLVELHELDQLVALVQGETTFRRLRHQQELWDKWFTVLLVSLLYCTDVAIRRIFGLA